MVEASVEAVGRPGQIASSMFGLSEGVLGVIDTLLEVGERDVDPARALHFVCSAILGIDGGERMCNISKGLKSRQAIAANLTSRFHPPFAPKPVVSGAKTCGTASKELAHQQSGLKLSLIHGYLSTPQHLNRQPHSLCNVSRIAKAQVRHQSGCFGEIIDEEGALGPRSAFSFLVCAR
ncbi:MAG: hypothetical protein KDI71_04330 [Xanthomonadales bacterium]|nr:hypothetical protein [Xanthomonadales bacterium]